MKFIGSKHKITKNMSNRKVSSQNTRLQRLYQIEEFRLLTQDYTEYVKQRCLVSKHKMAKNISERSVLFLNTRLQRICKIEVSSFKTQDYNKYKQDRNFQFLYTRLQQIYTRQKFLVSKHKITTNIYTIEISSF